jgi:hypothetical protein
LNSPFLVKLTFVMGFFEWFLNYFFHWNPGSWMDERILLHWNKQRYRHKLRSSRVSWLSISREHLEMLNEKWKIKIILIFQSLFYMHVLNKILFYYFSYKNNKILFIAMVFFFFDLKKNYVFFVCFFIKLSWFYDLYYRFSKFI